MSYILSLLLAIGMVLTLVIPAGAVEADTAVTSSLSVDASTVDILQQRLEAVKSTAIREEPATAAHANYDIEELKGMLIEVMNKIQLKVVNFFLTGILIIFCVLIGLEFTYRKSFNREYDGIIYVADENTFIQIEPETISIIGTLSYNIRTGVRIQGELINSTIDCFFITPTSELVENFEWYRALLSSGPPEPGPVSIYELSCNEVFFSKKMDALIFPMEQNGRRCFLILTENEGAIGSSLAIIAAFFE